MGVEVLCMMFVFSRKEREAPIFQTVPPIREKVINTCLVGKL